MELLELKGVGKKKVEAINSLGIFSVEDLLNYYPTRIEFKDYTDLYAVEVIIKVKVISVTKLIRTRNKLIFFRFTALYNNNVLTFTVFNQPYLHKMIKEKSEISVECKSGNGTFIVSRIIFDNNVPYISVKYKSNNKINSKQIKKLIDSSIKEHLDILHESISEKLRDKYKLLPIKQAIYLIHNPKNQNDYKNALRTLKYIEAYEFMKYISENNVDNLDFDFSDFDLSKSIKFTNNLPFALTSSQKSVVREMLDSVVKNKRFNYLVHGDVGCGKTLVSIVATNLFISNGKQVAILCPTEVLAVQMFENYSRHLENGVLLTSNTSKSDMLNLIKSGEYKYVVGTHSLLNDKVEFNNLGLVIIDEQQRFGVLQREKLINKQSNVNTMLMSATPIPRTVGLVLYDNVKVLPIKELPNNRKKVKTIFSNNLSDKIISDIKNEVKSNNSVFVIVPSIKESKLNISSIESVKSEYLKYFSDSNIATIHSKMKSDEINAVMENFKNGKVQILISTSIVEVGIDIPSATRVVIHSAKRFGLSTLHQLRGRVGRGGLDSICYVIDDEMNERIELFVSCNDGFEITEADFKIRGFGNLLGIEQSGYSMFKLLDIYEDLKIIECAKRDVENSLN